MASREQSETITEYWFRILLSTSFSVVDIVAIIVGFGDEYEKFDPLVSSKKIEFSDDNKMVYLPKTNAMSGQSVYGLIDAIPGRDYHWKLKLIEECMYVNIGVIECDKLDGSRGCWTHGTMYYQNGKIDATYKYGESLEKGDIIELCLDLKSKYELSYIVNGRDLGKIPNYDIKEDTTYKLAIGFYQNGKINLLSSKINY